MSQNLYIRIVLFYSNFNQESLKTRVAMHEFMNKHRYHFKIKAQEINYDVEKTLSKENGVTGTPTLLIFKDQKLLKRHLGEITSEEFVIMVNSIFKLLNN